MRQHLRRVAGFALLPAFSLLASLVLLPVVAMRFGADGWVALGTGQSVGAVVAIVCGLSWPTMGGHAVAIGDATERRRIFELSMVTRAVAVVAAIPIASLVVVVIDATYTGAVWLFMVGTALNSFSMSWFFGGAATPRHLAINEGVVRLLGYALASALLLAGSPLWVYALVTVGSGLASVTLNTRTIYRITAPHAPIGRHEYVGALRDQLGGTAARLGFAFFTFGGPTIFALGATGSVIAAFNGIDQLLKASVSATAILPQAFIAVVVMRHAHNTRWWRRPESLVLLWLPIAAVVTWTVLGRSAAGFLFSDELDASQGIVFLVGVALAATMALRSFETLVLVPRGLTATLFRINAVMSFGGVALLYAAARADSVAAGLAAWIVIHAGIFGCEVVALRRQGDAAVGLEPGAGTPTPPLL